MSNIVLSVCIPSYNRGHRAYNLVKSLLTFLDEHEEVEIVVSDNGSVENTEGYRKIQNLTNRRIKFNRFDKNNYFWGNVNKVLKMASGEFALLISDEDNIVLEALPHYIELCRQNDDVAVIRSKTAVTYQRIENDYGKKGVEAIKKYYLINNYISGVIYNRRIVTDGVVDCLYDLFHDNMAYRFYVHEVIDAYCVLCGDYLSSDVMLIQEGEPEEEKNESCENSDLHEYNTYESRIQQQHGFVEVAKKLWCAGEAEMAQMFLNTIVKTRHLFNVTQYVCNTASKEFAEQIQLLKEADIYDLKYLDLSVINNNIDMWMEFIDGVCS